MSTNDLSPGTLEDWLDRLSAQHPVVIDLGLDRLTLVAERLGLLAERLAPRVVTVAGTNGKGSTVAMIDACARAHGLSSVTYTSPHLLRYNERVRINGEEASDKQLIDAFEIIEKARLEAPAVSLSYFEVGTLAAALLIRQAAPDIAIMEVGLGGRLDAVNLFDADVSVVTTIGLDHAEYLGSDLSVIGREKAGIMRASGCAVLGSRELPASVRAHAEALGVQSVAELGVEFDYRVDTPSHAARNWSWQGISASSKVLELISLAQPGLPLDNAASALQALSFLDIDLEADTVSRAFAEISLPGRLQRIDRWILDVAHNPHAAHYIATQLKSDVLAPQSQSPVERIAVLAMLGDKDAEGVVAELNDVIQGWYCAGVKGPRARSGEDLAKLVKAQGGKVIGVSESVSKALDDIQEMPEWADTDILVCGSFLTVTAALEWLEAREISPS
ncbi:Dihydrofolate synthase/folylpolyglutamate synthase [Halomonadaceae bacterium LMG 33818]|uniref:bifunctional tetrahydrofolate synthase/dihydrofolate synthase n=1 Tax=Cernens ardua TaxID=3402176 RepID=UPI003EDBB67C